MEKCMNVKHEQGCECGNFKFKDTISKSRSNVGLDAPVVDEEMLARAMKKAVEVGIFPKHPVDTETYLKHWDGMKAVLQTVVGN